MHEVPAPDGFAAAWDRVLTHPSRTSGDALLDVLEAWVGHLQPADDSLSQFIRDNELAWLHGTIPPEFW